MALCKPLNPYGQIRGPSMRVFILVVRIARLSSSSNVHIKRPHQTSTSNVHIKRPHQTSTSNVHIKRPHQTSTSNVHIKRPHQTSTLTNGHRCLQGGF